MIGFIGAGAMGLALIEGFIKAGINKDNIIASVKTKEKKEQIEKNLEIKTFNNNKKIAEEAFYL